MTNDLYTDQRVKRVATLLAGQGYEVRGIGRRLASTPQNPALDFPVHRYKMLFTKGPLFYAFYNKRLFFSLLFCRQPALFISNDLDTLTPNFLVSRIRRVPLIYDSHEYFTEVPELINRKGTRAIWKWIEGRIVPRLKHAVTVTASIAEAYAKMYGTRFRVVRNVPEKKVDAEKSLDEGADSAPILIYQGALNVGRGIELMIDSMQYLEGMKLCIAGAGDIEKELVERVARMGLEDQVIFKGRLHPDELAGLTASASLGLSLEEDRGLNYRYSLPNKIFDYIHAGIPVICSDLPEMSTLVQSYQVGAICKERKAESVAKLVKEVLAAKEKGAWGKSLEKARSELCWEKEAKHYLELIAATKITQTT